MAGTMFVNGNYLTLHYFRAEAGGISYLTLGTLGTLGTLVRVTCGATGLT